MARRFALTPFSILAFVAAWIALAGPAAAVAEVIAVNAQPAVWLEPHRNGVTALLEDGTVIHVGGGRSTIVARNWTSEELWGCGGQVYGVDGRGRIATAAGHVGPGVATYSTPACLPDGDLVAVAAGGQTVLRLSPSLDVVASAAVDALADTIVTYAPGDADAAGVVALLAEPTFRYRHGVLGDEVEAAALVVLSAEDLAPLAQYRLPPPAVIEQRGVVPYRFGSRRGFYVTRSTDSAGAGVVALELIPTAGGGELRPSAAAPPIGSGERWLNLFAARDDFAYAVRTPHVGGPFERYRLSGSTLAPESFDLGVTNHVFGSRNVALGALLPPAGETTRLVLPRRDLHALRVIACDEGCRVTDELPLSGRLLSNVAVAVGRGDGALVYASDDAGAIHAFMLDVGEPSH